eukprot:3229552-Rhodomonas_salina.6
MREGAASSSDTTPDDRHAANGSNGLVLLLLLLWTRTILAEVDVGIEKREVAVEVPGGSEEEVPGGPWGGVCYVSTGHCVGLADVGTGLRVGVDYDST